MKISSSFNNIYGVYNNTKPAISRKKTTGKEATDIYDVSREAKDYNTIYKAVMQSPDIREDKIKAISKQIEEGTYNVSAQALAEKILSGYM